jgi:hypothetical protein
VGDVCGECVRDGSFGRHRTASTRRSHRRRHNSPVAGDKLASRIVLFSMRGSGTCPKEAY